MERKAEIYGGTISRMNERAEFLRHFRLVFVNIVERLDTMTESQVFERLLEVRAARDIWKEELTEQFGEIIKAEPREGPRVVAAKEGTREQLAHLASIQAFFYSVNKLRSRVGPKAPPPGPRFFDLLEDALKQRLDLLRKEPSGDC